MTTTEHIPADLDAERAFIGCILTDPRAVALAQDLDASDLYDVRHRDILTTARDMFRDGMEVDPTSVHSRLRPTSGARDLKFLMSVTGGGWAPSLPQYMASIALWARLRRAHGAAHAAGRAMASGDADGAHSAFGKVSLHVAGVEKRNPVVSFEESGNAVLERLYSPGEIGGVGIRTGFAAIDDGALGLLGFHRTHLTVLAARPAMGKTALALNLAWNVARTEGPVLFSCGEMSHQQLTERLLAYISQVPYPGIRSGRLEHWQREQVCAAYNELCRTPLYLWDRAAVTSNDVLAKSRWVAARAGQGVAMVVVDYLQRMGCDERTADKRHRVEHNAEALKTMASNEGVHVLLLSQLNRSCEAREDKRPMASDLRESGTVEQEANQVLMLYRDHVYYPDADPCAAELLVRKARGARTGRIDLKWQGELMTFRG